MFGDLDDKSRKILKQKAQKYVDASPAELFDSPIIPQRSAYIDGYCQAVHDMLDKGYVKVNCKAYDMSSGYPVEKSEVNLCQFNKG